MAELSFPVSPSVGDTYTANGRTWRWGGNAWIIVSNAALNDIQDVALDAPASGEVLTYNGTTWENLARPYQVPLFSGMGYAENVSVESRVVANNTGDPIISLYELPGTTSISGFTIYCSSAVSGGDFVVMAYEMNNDGTPGDLLAHEPFDLSTTGWKTALFAAPVLFPKNVFVGGYNPTVNAGVYALSNTAYLPKTWQRAYTSITFKHSGYIGPANPGTNSPPDPFIVIGSTRYSPVVWLVAA